MREKTRDSAISISEENCFGNNVQFEAEYVELHDSLPHNSISLSKASTDFPMLSHAKNSAIRKFLINNTTKNFNPWKPRKFRNRENGKRSLWFGSQIYSSIFCLLEQSDIAS